MVANPMPWTIRDLDGMPDDGSWKRYEIVAGDLLVTPAPHSRHQGVADQIYLCLDAWCRQTGLGKAFPAPGIVFTEIDAVVPDVVWITPGRLVNGVDTAGYLTVAPELVVEIHSPGKKHKQRDQDLKLELYSLYGVREFWKANWQVKTMKIYRPRKKHLQLITTLRTNDVLTSPLLPGFETGIEGLFP